MSSQNYGSVTRTAGHPILSILVSFPIACFIGALVTDIAYALSADMLWANFSAWLLAAGIFFGVLAAVGGIIDVIANHRLRTHRQAWPVIIGSLLVLILGFWNNLVHSRDAWTSVMPLGLILSAATVIVMLITAWIGRATANDRNVNLQYSGVR